METTARIVEFLNTIGIPTLQATIEEPTFLPGLRVRGGTLEYDPSRLTYPGDLLHEAGHLAVLPARLRGLTEDDMVAPEGALGPPLEIEAIAWSYAAILHLRLDPRIVFHQGGYHGASEPLLASFGMGVFIGLENMRAAGMTALGEEAARLGVPPYPHMIRWLRD